MSQSHLLVPSLFILLIQQILALIVVQSTSHENIIEAFEFKLLKTDDIYISAKSSVDACCILGIIMNIIQLILLYDGRILFQDFFSQFMIFLHFIGIMLYCDFCYMTWSYTYIWLIWTFFRLFLKQILSLLPFLVCFLSLYTVRTKFIKL